MSRQQYLEPVPYFALNNDEVAALQREAGTLRMLIEARGTPWRDRENASARLKDIERRLQSARFAVEKSAEQRAQNRDARPRVAVSDDGGSLLCINCTLADLLKR